MSKRFDGKRVWITGGGSGIGRAMALEFARQGASVAVSGRRVSRLLEVVVEIEELGAQAVAVECDVCSEASVEASVARVLEELGGLDVAVANAGFALAGSIEELSAEQWRRQLDVNVVGAALTARYALPPLRESGGRVALVSSIMGMLASKKIGAYTASKYAVRAIGQTLSLELAGSGVSCTTLYPGYVASEIAQVDNEGRHHPDAKDRRPARLIWPTDKAARVMVDAIHKRKREYVFTGHGKVAGFFGRHAPSLVHLAQSRGRG